MLLVTRGPVLILSPSPWVRLCLASVCVSGKGRLRVDFALSSYICFSVESLSGCARPFLRVPVSFLASLPLPHLTPPPFSISSSTSFPTPTNRREGQPLPRQGRVDLGGPVSPDRGQIGQLTAPTLREEGVPERGPLASP